MGECVWCRIKAGARGGVVCVLKPKLGVGREAEIRTSGVF